MRLSWVEKLLFLLVCLEVCNPIAPQEHIMEAHRDCTSGVCPDASATGEFVSIYVDYNHPLLQLKRALPWEGPLRGDDVPLAASRRKTSMAALACRGMWPCTCLWSC